MRVSIEWLRQLVELPESIERLVGLLPLRTIDTKDITDRSIELDMKGYNRADLLSMRGVALETSAITGGKILFTEPEESKYFWVEKELPQIKAQVEDTKASPFYCLVKIDGLKVEQSSKEIQQKLADSGMRAVNSIADITNMVMLEYGQPLHAFDAGKIKDETIIVRQAKSGEILKTLDGKDRQLVEQDIVIADSEKAVGLAGVMGGENTEITDDTSSILLEAAIFDPVQLRRTATRLNLSSEAGKRFYHGLTKKRLLQALNAAIIEYQKLGGRVNGIVLVGESTEPQHQIPVTLDKIVGLIGTPITAAQVEQYLQSLHFNLLPQTDAQGNAGWVVTPPYYRLDIEIEEDVIEEIARMYGYENIPAQPLLDNQPVQVDQSEFETITKVKQTLVGLGLTEVQTYSFYSTEVLEALGWTEDRRSLLLKITNPMSAETEYMRQTVWANLAEVAAKNLKQGVKDVAIFEVGKVYQLTQELAINEYNSLAISVVGDGELAIKELHQYVEKMCEVFGKKAVFTQGLGELPVELYHPTRQFKLAFDDKPVGGIAEVHPRVMFKLGLEGKRVAVCEIPLSALITI